ncbi:hypothetical protein Egran_03839 [Elaphomyces granulatus]|uniref:Histone deacetylase domain-containing protein n=1 Tax=Elaphomyces granulatus TaxID=519963 RepID=A0A232LWJ8_9EURO|nr:hypothetical protein Egran_03839 [Elaphomyces granulatus]
MAGPGNSHDISIMSQYMSGPLNEQDTPTKTHDANVLSDHLSRLSLTTTLGTPVFSPFSPSRSSSQHSQSQLRHVSSSSTIQPRTTPRRTPSTTSLREERRQSTPSLQKRLSTSSLRSVNHGGGTPPRPSLSRRSSASYLPSPTPTIMRSKPPLDTPVELPVPTASSVGAEHFEREMRLHRLVDLRCRTVVIIQDACYGHRFSRPRTSKTTLSSIVERPERLRAGILGLATAYVRVGKRHAGEPFSPHPDLPLDLLPVPPFQIRKTSRSLSLNAPAVTHVHGTKWMDELKAMCNAAESRLALNSKELVRPRSGDKDDSSNTPRFHEGDLYLCPESLNAFEGALGGVCEAVDAVFNPSPTRRAFVCIRPPGHHCSSNHPSGFCWLNNVHVGITYAAMTYDLTHAAILDFDLHHGDGSQAIAWEQNRRAISAAKNSVGYKKTMIGYYSLHDINSYPCEMGEEDKVRNASVCIDNAHGQSIWNIHLEPWKSHAEFWRLYEYKYSILLEKARNFLHFHTDRLLSSPNSSPPKAAIFLSAGFDASEWEGIGMQRHKVNVPTDFYARFTADVVRLAEEEGLATDGRIISVLEGGYSDRALTSGVLSHISSLADSRSSTYGDDQGQQSRLASEMMGHLRLDETAQTLSPRTGNGIVAFDTEWWAPESLKELEALVYPPPAQPSKKHRERAGPSFFAPTQASVAKTVTPTKDRKRMGYQTDGDPSVPSLLPEVDWATAAHELFKTLIPGDRQTTSHRPEDLSAEASRIRRERFVAAERPATPVVTDETRMQLRERKPKSSPPAGLKLETPRRTSSKSSRRTTIASVNDLPDPTMGESPTIDCSQRSRRQSAASSVTDSGDFQKEPGRRTLGNGVMKTGSRPGTAASEQPSATVVVKKPRAASGSRSSTLKRQSSPKKAPPVPKVPVPYLNTVPGSSPVESQSSEPSIQTPQTRSRPVNGAGKNQDIDNIASGMRKLNIKLKVPSLEENAIRENRAAGLEERKKSAVRSPRKQVGAKAAKAVVSKGVTETPSHSEYLQTTAPPVLSDLSDEGIRTDCGSISKPGTAVSSSHMLPPETSSSTISSSATRVSEMEAPALELSTANKEGQVSTDSLPPQPSLIDMSPLLSPGPAQAVAHPQIAVQSPPASVGQAQHNLPTFASTGPIPFAPPGAHGVYRYGEQDFEIRPPQVYLSPKE